MPVTKTPAICTRPAEYPPGLTGRKEAA